MAVPQSGDERLARTEKDLGTSRNLDVRDRPDTTILPRSTTTV